MEQNEEMLRIRAWGEEHNAKVRENIEESSLPTAQEIIDSITD